MAMTDEELRKILNKSLKNGVTQPQSNVLGNYSLNSDLARIAAMDAKALLSKKAIPGFGLDWQEPSDVADKFKPKLEVGFDDPDFTKGTDVLNDLEILNRSDKHNAALAKAARDREELEASLRQREANAVAAEIRRKGAAADPELRKHISKTGLSAPIINKLEPGGFSLGGFGKGEQSGEGEQSDVAYKFGVTENEPDIKKLLAKKNLDTNFGEGLGSQTEREEWVRQQEEAEKLELASRAGNEADEAAIAREEALKRAAAAGNEADEAAIQRERQKAAKEAERAKAENEKNTAAFWNRGAEGVVNFLTGGALDHNKTTYAGLIGSNPNAHKDRIAAENKASDNLVNDAMGRNVVLNPETGEPIATGQTVAGQAVTPSATQPGQMQTGQGTPQNTVSPTNAQGTTPPQSNAGAQAGQTAQQNGIPDKVSAIINGDNSVINQEGGEQDPTKEFSNVLTGAMFKGIESKLPEIYDVSTGTVEERQDRLRKELGHVVFTLDNITKVEGNDINGAWINVLSDKDYDEIEAQTFIDANNIQNQYINHSSEFQKMFPELKGLNGEAAVKKIIDILGTSRGEKLLNLARKIFDDDKRNGRKPNAWRNINDYIPEEAQVIDPPPEAPEPELPEPSLPPDPEMPEQQLGRSYFMHLKGEDGLASPITDAYKAAAVASYNNAAAAANRTAAMGAIADKIDNMKFDLGVQANQLAETYANADPQQYRTAVQKFINDINKNEAYSPYARNITQMEREARKQIMQKTTQSLISEMQKSSMETQREQVLVNSQNRATTTARQLEAGKLGIQEATNQMAAANNSARQFLSPAQRAKFEDQNYLTLAASAGQWAMNEAAKKGAYGEIADMDGVLAQAAAAAGSAEGYILASRGEDAAEAFKGEADFQMQKTAKAVSDHNFTILDAAQNQYTEALGAGKAGWPMANSIAYEWAPLRNKLIESGALIGDDARRAAPYFKFKTDEGSGGSGGSGGNGRTIYSALDGLAKDYAKEVENDLHGRGGLSFLEAQEMIMKDAGAEKTDDGAREYAAKALASELLKSTNIKEQDFDPIWTRFFGSPMSAAEIKDAYEGMTTSEAQQFSNELYASRIQDAIQTLRNKPENEPTDKYMEAHQPELAARFTVAQFGLINDALTADLRTKAQEIGLTNAELSPIFDSFQTPLPINSARSARTNLATNETYAAMEETLIDRYARIRSATDAGFGEKDEHKMQLESSGGRAILTDTNKRGKTEYFEIVKEGDKYYLNTFKEALYPEDDQSKKLNASGEMLPHQYAREPDRRLNLSYNVNVEAAPNGYTIPIEKRRRLELEGKIDEYKDWKWPKQK